jgi:DNA polymerase-3 subunit alpha
MMRIARDLGGFTLAEADTLRKAIGKKIKDLLAEQQVKIISGMIKNGIAEKTAKEIWELFPPFARYGFNRSHAACYGMIAYQTAYLKAHYPVEFMTALLNVSGTDIERINFLVTETKKMGIPVLPPDVNASDENFSAEEKSIRFGLLAIKNLGAGIVEAIIQERGRGGPFADLKDMATRIKHRDLNKKSLEALIKSGALDSIGLDRAQAVANLEDIVTFVQNVKKAEQANQSSLFGGTAIFTGLRLKPADQIPKVQLLSWEKELLGLYVSDHPIKNMVEKIKKTGAKVRPIREALALPKRGKNGPRVVICAVVSNIHKILTKKGDPMLFVGVEDGETATEMMVFGEVMQKHPTAWEENKILLAAGRFSFRGEDEPKFVCDDVRIIQA